MKKKISPKRLIGGVLFTIAFIIFAYISCSVAVHSSDTRGYEVMDHGQNSLYGYDRDRYLINHGRADEASAATVAAYTAPEEVQNEESVSVPAAEAPVPTPIPTPEPTVDPNSPAARAAALGLPAPPEIAITEWQYLLVNAAHQLETVDYAPESMGYLNMTGDETDIQTTHSDYRCAVDLRIAQALVDFTQACKAAGLPVYLSSGYRSYNEQQYLYNRKVGQGYSEEVAKTIVAYPGTSEHQTGLCCDITDYYRETKDSSLAQTATYQWLCDHCTEYGFVVRYPEDKSGSADSITGIIYEPWHFRYVGVEAAKYMTENHLCLEEFTELYI